MWCEVCGRGPQDGVTLLRQNPKGEVGIWRCESCNTQPVDPDLAEAIELGKIISEIINEDT